MAMWYRFKPLNLEVKGKPVEFINGSDDILYYPDRKHLKFKIKYFTGDNKSILGIPIREKDEFNITLQLGDYEVTNLEQGDEQTRQVKNLGGGALLGAAVAGPIGAAVGACIASTLKSCPSIITIPSMGVKLESLVPIGYLKEHAKNKFFTQKSEN